MGEPLKGFFYREQLTKVSKTFNPETHLFEVEKVLRKKQNKGKTYYFVKFAFYPSKFNLWLPAENIETKLLNN